MQQLPDTAAATSKWGAIGDWDVSGVGDFSYAFSAFRDKAGGSWVFNGNPKASAFVGTDISKWITTSVTSLERTFLNAVEMNADLIGWSVGKVATLAQTFNGASKFAGTGLSSWITTSVTSLFYTFRNAVEMNTDLSKWSVGKATSMQNTFNGASKFAGVGLDAWDVSKVNDMTATFNGATALTSCSKRKIADAWKSNSVFTATTYDTDWVADACPVRTRRCSVRNDAVRCRSVCV